MQTALSFSQGTLGILFTLAGLAKFVLSANHLGKIMHWTTHFPESSVRFIAASELLGGTGLLFTWAMGGILPTLAVAAAFGLAALMLLAVFHHVEHEEKGAVAVNLLLFVMAAFVIWGRLR